jgi:hypothetical protein
MAHLNLKYFQDKFPKASSGPGHGMSPTGIWNLCGRGGYEGCVWELSGGLTQPKVAMEIFRGTEEGINM